MDRGTTGAWDPSDVLRSLRVVLLCALLSFLVAGITPADTSASVDPRSQHTLDAITTATFDTADPQASFPTDWVQVMGYRPAVAVGPDGVPILIKPTGDCSSFSGETGYGFGWVCKEHDLAYDVLRYSDRVGHPLPAASRQQADEMFGRELHQQCTYAGVKGTDYVWCHTWAESFVQTVEVNSWRQGFRPPIGCCASRPSARR